MLNYLRNEFNMSYRNVVGIGCYGLINSYREYMKDKKLLDDELRRLLLDLDNNIFYIVDLGYGG